MSLLKTRPECTEKTDISHIERIKRENQSACDKTISFLKSPDGQKALKAIYSAIQGTLK